MICVDLFLHDSAAFRKDIWHALRMEKLLINQQSVPSESGLCGAACTINIAQALALKAGVAPIKDPQTAFQQFVESRGGLNGGMSTLNIIDGIKSVVRSFLGIKRWRISATKLRPVAPKMNRADLRNVDSFSLEDLSPQPNQLKIVQAFLFNRNEELIYPGSTHAFIIDGITGKWASIVEPNAPYEWIMAEMTDVGEINGYKVPNFVYKLGMPGEIMGFLPAVVITIEFPKD